ncbi:MAG: UDP-2,3-diacylglucosamine diphosphatase [Gammaproteobacteria bacterium AqS3]|nr:UDP-2,3-diacylglucosamine diphosphatase [Gammaproteobacteria bacterium AqS3]
MKRLLISDLHLHANAPERIAALLELLRVRTRHFDELLILGDLFDAWIGDDENESWVDPVLEGISECARRGMSVGIQHGNRDFLIGEGFTARSGATVLPEYLMLEVAGEPALLIHGDQLCTDDIDYQAARERMRRPEWCAAFLGRPLDERRKLAVGMREESRQAAGTLRQSGSEMILDVAPAAVDAVMAEYDVRLLIHGHTHRPAVHQLAGSRRRFVLGDWDRTGWCIEADDKRCELIEFPIR